MKLANALVVVALLMHAMPGVSEARPHCTDEDREYAADIQGSDADDAYKFGRLIQENVRNRDLAGLFGLVDGELKHGPRRRFVSGRTFGEVFTEDWRSAVLGSEPDCRPVGWRGFMLASGLVWYAFDHFGSGRWTIVSINRAAEERYPLTGAGLAWRSEGRIIGPDCFEREWLSSDNFEAFEGAFGIADADDFRRNTGRYFGREIDRLDPIDTPWSEEEVRLVTFPPACNTTSPTVRGDAVSSESCDAAGYCLQSAYRLLAPVPLAACRSLAPHLAGRCEDAYLVLVHEETGGSMGAYVTFNIYGLFVLNDGRRAMVPLVNFHRENDARNFVDDIGIAN